jgi:hypothetical protein
MPIILDIQEDFDDRNAFLLVLLGALSAVRQLGALLRVPAPPTRPPNKAADESDSSVDLVLGLVACARHCVHCLETAAEPRDQSPEPELPHREPIDWRRWRA